MHKYFLFITACSLFFISCDTNKKESSLGGTFVESLGKGQFEMLEPYFPTVEFYKSLGGNAPERSDEEIVKFLDGSKERLKNAWTSINERIKSAKTDLSAVDIKETLVYSPFSEKKIQAMVVVYEYENKTWDDMLFTVSEWNGKTYLLEIPNTERFLSMEDSSLRASAEAKLSLEMNKPEFNNSVKKKVEDIIGYAKENKVKEFTESVVYRGNDENRRWKSAMSMNDTAEAQEITGLMSQVNGEMSDCSNYTFNEIRTGRESEGTWIVMPVNCGNKIVYFAFLKTDDQLLLGDVDKETIEK